MNAATRVGTHSVFTGVRTGKQTQSWSLHSTMILSLLILVFISAFSVVYVRGHQRQLVTHLQNLQIEHDNMLVERSQLLLEQAAWSTQTRVQRIAQADLGMVFPQQQSMIMVEE
jgi:cell division protein FtsL